MAEPKLLASFPRCPNCGSESTISELGCADLKERGIIPKYEKTRLRVETVPLQQPLMAGVTVPVIVTEFDVCANCGLERCVRSSLVQAPVQSAVPPTMKGNLAGFRSNGGSP